MRLRQNPVGSMFGFAVVLILTVMFTGFVVVDAWNGRPHIGSAIAAAILGCVLYLTAGCMSDSPHAERDKQSLLLVRLWITVGGALVLYTLLRSTISIARA